MKKWGTDAASLVDLPDADGMKGRNRAQTLAKSDNYWWLGYLDDGVGLKIYKSSDGTTWVLDETHADVDTASVVPVIAYHDSSGNTNMAYVYNANYIGHTYTANEGGDDWATFNKQDLSTAIQVIHFFEVDSKLWLCILKSNALYFYWDDAGTWTDSGVSQAIVWSTDDICLVGPVEDDEWYFIAIVSGTPNELTLFSFDGSSLTTVGNTTDYALPEDGGPANRCCLARLGTGTWITNLYGGDNKDHLVSTTDDFTTIRELSDWAVLFATPELWGSIRYIAGFGEKTASSYSWFVIDTTVDQVYRIEEGDGPVSWYRAPEWHIVVESGADSRMFLEEVTIENIAPLSFDQETGQAHYPIDTGIQDDTWLFVTDDSDTLLGRYHVRSRLSGPTGYVADLTGANKLALEYLPEVTASANDLDTILTAAIDACPHIYQDSSIDDLSAYGTYTFISDRQITLRHLVEMCQHRTGGLFYVDPDGKAWFKIAGFTASGVSLTETSDAIPLTDSDLGASVGTVQVLGAYLAGSQLESEYTWNISAPTIFRLEYPCIDTQAQVDALAAAVATQLSGGVVLATIAYIGTVKWGNTISLDYSNIVDAFPLLGGTTGTYYITRVGYQPAQNRTTMEVRSALAWGSQTAPASLMVASSLAADLGTARYCRVREDVDQTIGTGSYTTITWQAADEDEADANYYTVGTNKVTVLKAGVYLVACNLGWNDTSSDFEIHCRLRQNTTVIITEKRVNTTGDEPASPMNHLAYPLRLAANDEINFQAYQDSGGNIDTAYFDLRILYMGT